MRSKLTQILAAAALMATSVITQSASADIARTPRDGRGYERWICQTQSRGYQFRAEGRSYNEANYNVQSMCMNHPYGSNSECRYNTQCSQVGGGYPQPHPQRVYTCQTFGGGRWYQGRSPSLNQAQRRAVNQCRANPYSRLRECERNLQCGY